MWDSYIDDRGYVRSSPEHSNLIHRQVAYSEVYLPNRHLYPLPFSQYQVHHLDGDKRNNAPDNLELVTREQHERIHGLRKRRGFYFYLTRGLAMAATLSILAGKVALALSFLEVLFTAWLVSLPIRAVGRIIRWRT